MVIKHGGHILGEIHEVRKGIWAFIFRLCFSDADWLARQISITWRVSALNYSWRNSEDCRWYTASSARISKTSMKKCKILPPLHNRTDTAVLDTWACGSAKPNMHILFHWFLSGSLYIKLVSICSIAKLRKQPPHCRTRKPLKTTVWKKIGNMYPDQCSATAFGVLRFLIPYSSQSSS